MDTAFELDQKLNLSPLEVGVSATWGNMRLINSSGMWDGAADAYTTDGRLIRILTGVKSIDLDRNYETDPSYATLTVSFGGVGQNWYLDETYMIVPLRDVTYFVERPLQTSRYSGSGTYGGTAELIGVIKPKTRGGTSSYPVKNITPVLVDPTNRIYQYNDAAGTVVALYEGGATNITFQADTTNLYSGTTTAGQYRTDNSRGLFQLGSTPVYQITADVTGAFPSGTVYTNPADIARYLLQEDMGLDVSFIDTTSFAAAASACSYVTGWYFNEAVDGPSAVAPFLAACHAKMVSLRNRKLGIVLVRDIAGTSPFVTWGTETVVSVSPIKLTAPLDPPAFRWFVGYNKNNTIQSSAINPTVTDTRRQVLAKQWASKGWSSSTIIAGFRNPSDPPIIGSALLNATDAQTLVDKIGGYWGYRRKLYSVTVPWESGQTRELGDVIRLRYPIQGLRDGALGIIVGMQMRSGDSGMTFQVIV
jgi:hypothetical protein